MLARQRVFIRPSRGLGGAREEHCVPGQQDSRAGSQVTLGEAQWLILNSQHKT